MITNMLYYLQGSHSDALKEYRRYRRGYVNKWLVKRRIKAFYSVTIAPDFRQGARSLMQVLLSFIIFVLFIFINE